MKGEEIELVVALVKKTLSKEKFLRLYPVNLHDVRKQSEYILCLLEEAFSTKSSKDLDHSMCLGFVFGFTQNHTNILCQLIQENWHYKHEDIASVLKNLKAPESVECLYKTTLTNFEYLSYDDSYALGVKCIYALGAIDTEAAKEKLHQLAKSDKHKIRNAAEYLLNSKPR